MSSTNNQPLPSTPQKPINGRKVTLLGVAVFAVLVVISLVVSFMNSTPNAPSKQLTMPASTPAVDQFSSDLQTTTAVVKGNIENMRKITALAQEMHAALPDCDDAMRKKLKGAYFVMKSRNPEIPDMNLVCQPDNQWALIPPSARSIVTETPGQRSAEASAGSGGKLSPAERLKIAREQAFRSNPIPVHFGDESEQVGARAAGSQTTVEQSDLPPGATRATARATAPVPAPTASAGATPSNAAVNAPTSAQGVRDERAAPIGVQLSSFSGDQYPVFSGRIIEGLLVNRLMGDQNGPVKVQVSTDVWDHSNQHLLIKQGSTILGENYRVEAAGQKRLATVFKRIIMPDGWSFMLDDFQGLDQQGAAGLGGKVDKHLFQLIGTAVMVGAIEGLSDFTNVGTGGAVVEIQGGMSRESGTEAMQILRNAMNRPAGITVYEGSLVRIYVKTDKLLPDYLNHVVKPSL